MHDVSKAPTGGGAETLRPPVASHKEWDPLEEVVVGRLDRATTPSRHSVVSCDVPPVAARFQRLTADADIHRP